MFELKYATKDDIPAGEDALAEMFVERDGAWHFNAAGVKTQADIDKQQEGLTAERAAHTATKAKLAVWGEMDHSATQLLLDRIPELEAAGADKLDQAGIDAIVTKRVEGVINSRLAPLQREIRGLTTERDDFAASNKTLSGDALTRAREDYLRPLCVAANVRPEHIDDVFMHAERVLERAEDRKSWFVRDGATGVTAGSDGAGWLGEMLEKRPGWLPESHGGGAKGSKTGGGFGGVNPWKHGTWNATQQAQLINQKGKEYCDKLAAAAGTTVGGLKPAK